jgi:hypothetical protein
MPKFVNQNKHPVRVKDNNGNLRRVRQGEVVTAEGEMADALSNSNGVETASAEDEKNWQEKLDQRSADQSEGTPAAQALKEAGELIASVRRTLISDPLQVVIGDAAAPFGPPHGEQTTKDEWLSQNEGDPLVKLAFGEQGAPHQERINEERKTHGPPNKGHIPVGIDVQGEGGSPDRPGESPEQSAEQEKTDEALAEERDAPKPRGRGRGGNG